MRKAILLGSALAMIAVLMIATPTVRAADPDLSGTYTSHGVNADGRPYEGIVDIVRMDVRYYVHWTFPGSPEEAVGVGVWHDDRLVVGLVGGGAVGVATYRRHRHELTGLWALSAMPGTYPETLTWQSPSAPHPHPLPGSRSEAPTTTAGR